MIEEKFQNHFFVVHTFVSEELRKEYLTPPEKCNPPQKQLLTEKKWAQEATGDFAQCMQTWVGNDDFLYCHWKANSEDDVYRQLDEWELEGKIVISKVNELHQFVTAYRGSDTVIREYPAHDGKWQMDCETKDVETLILC